MNTDFIIIASALTFYFSFIAWLIFGCNRKKRRAKILEEMNRKNEYKNLCETYGPHAIELFFGSFEAYKDSRKDTSFIEICDETDIFCDSVEYTDIKKRLSKGDLMIRIYSEKELSNIDSATPIDTWKNHNSSIHVMNYNNSTLGELENLFTVAKDRKIDVMEFLHFLK